MSIRIGKYSVIQPLGTGGMAEVFKCRLSGIGGFDKVLVVKRLLPHLAHDTEFVRMFLDEARVTANLNHPNIVAVYEIDEVDGIPYMAMEYVHGPTLWALMRLLRRKPESRNLGHLSKIMAGVSAGLHWAHNAHDADGEPLGIIHRDVSPQNILITLTGLPKICDFGVAKARGRLATTQAGTLKGKFRYIAPEQIRSDIDLDHRADVFSAGVCLFEATTGHIPFRGESEAQLIHSVASGHYSKPSAFNPAYPEELERIVQWALEPHRDQRCPTAKHLQDALEGFVTKAPHQSSQPEVAAWLRELFSDAQSGAFRVVGANTPDWSKAEAPLPGESVDSDAAPTLAQRVPSSSGRKPVPQKPPLGRSAWLAIAAGVVFVVAGAAALLWPTSPPSRPKPPPVVVQQPKPKPSVTEPTPPPRSGTDAWTAKAHSLDQLTGNGEWDKAMKLLETLETSGDEPPDARPRLSMYRERIERSLALQKARGLLSAGSAQAALDEAQKVLKTHPSDSDWQAIATDARHLLLPPTVTVTSVPNKSSSNSRAGRLSVLADPPANVWIDHKTMGKTPLQNLNLKEGKHEIQVSLSGYVSQRRTISVGRGRDSEISFVLAASPPRLAMATAQADDAGAIKTNSVESSKPVESSVVASNNSPSDAGSSDTHAVGVAATAANGVANNTPSLPSKPRPSPSNPGKPRLPSVYSARSIPDLIHALGVIENEAVSRGGVQPDLAHDITGPLAEDLMSNYAPGETLELYPKATYYLLVEGASKGKDESTLANEIRQAQRQGRLRSSASRGE